MRISDTQRYYSGVVWTDHAIERLKKRRITQSDAAAVLRKPDKTYPGKKDDTVKFIRTINQRRIHIVAKLNQDKEWIILTAWVRGEEDQWGLPERWLIQAVEWFGRQIIKLFRQAF